MKHTYKGFTLVELLVVVAIIGLLAGIAVVSVNSVRVKARDAKRIADVKQIQNALELYNNTKGGFYPPTVGDADLNLGEATKGGMVISENGFEETAPAAGEVYMNVIPTDPTSGNFYAYKSCFPKAPQVCDRYNIQFKTEGPTTLGVADEYCANPTGISPTGKDSAVCSKGTLK